MSDIDSALSLLQNKVRRQILEKLVREPHYPMHLADLTGVSQQAIVKHLKALEKGGLVQKEKVPSEKGGPPKTVYTVNESFSLRIDLGPDLYNCEQRKLPSGGPMRLSSRLPQSVIPIVDSVSGRKKIAVGEGMGYLSELNDAIETLDRQRDALMALHQQIRGRIGAAVEADFEVYEERTIVHSIVESKGQLADFSNLADELRLNTPEFNQLMESVSKRLEHQLAKRAGHVIAVNPTSKLRWWVPPSKD